MFSMKRGTIIPKITRTTMLFLVNYYGQSRTATFSFPLKAFTFFFCLLMLRHFIKAIEWKVVNQSKYSNLTTMKSIKLKNSYDFSLIRKKIFSGVITAGLLRINHPAPPLHLQANCNQPYNYYQYQVGPFMYQLV